VLATGTCLHAVPGRLRIRIPNLKASTRLAAALESELERVEGIRSVEANPVTGNVLIVYDPTSPAGAQLHGIVGGHGRFPGRLEPRHLVRERLVDAVVRSTVEVAVTSLFRTFVV
jgi:hypothetical protein